METSKIVFMAAGQPIGSNVFGKTRALAQGADFEPHLLYWDRGGTSHLSFPVASGLPEERVHRVGVSGGGGLVARLCACLESRRVLKRLKPWRVNSSSLDLLLAAVTAVRPAGGFVFDLQDSRTWMTRWWLRPLVRALLTRTRLVTVTSPRFESHFLRRYGLIARDHRVLCVPNPVDRDRFRDYRPRAAGQDIVIGYIGTFRGQAAIRALVSAIAQARETGVPVTGFFAGMGPELPLVKALCDGCGYLAYHGPFDQSCDIARLYGQANLMYAVYDDSEDKRIHWPCRMGESAFARIPIIVMSDSYMAELVSEHGLGFSVPLGTPQALVDVFRRVWQDRGILREIAENCRRAEPLFAFERYAPQFLAACRDPLVADHGGLGTWPNDQSGSAGSSSAKAGGSVVAAVPGSQARAYRICTNCVMDTSDTQIRFDASGVCDHCRDFREHVAPRWCTDARGAQALEELGQRIREAGQGKPFDCIMGMSGGADSSYLLHLAVTQMGLRPLVFHVDGGWNSQIAVNNIEVLIRKLNLELYTEVINWEEMKEFQLCYLKSGLPNVDVPQDHAFVAVLYNFARQHDTRYILNGGNISTECVRNPMEWLYYGTDMAQIRDLLQRFARFPLRSYPFSGVLRHKLYLRYVRGVQVVKPLNYVPYVKAEAMAFLEKEYGWQSYPQKHFESRFTRFYEGYWLPRRFGYDTRRVQFSSFILTGQMTRGEGLHRLATPALDDQEGRREFEYVASKLGISTAELQAYFDAPKRTHRDYRNREWLFVLGAKAMKWLGLEGSIKR